MELNIEEIVARHVAIDSDDASIIKKVYLSDEGTIRVDVEHDLKDIEPAALTKEFETIIEGKFDVDIITEDDDLISLILELEEQLRKENFE